MCHHANQLMSQAYVSIAPVEATTNICMFVAKHEETVIIWYRFNFDYKKKNQQ